MPVFAPFSSSVSTLIKISQVHTPQWERGRSAGFLEIEIKKNEPKCLQSPDKCVELTVIIFIFIAQ